MIFLLMGFESSSLPAMASAVERRREEHARRSRSPARGRERRGTPPRRRSSPERRKGSPARARSPAAKSSASHRDRERSPPREKVKERVRSPESPAKVSLLHKGRERSSPREKAKDQRVRSPKRKQEQSRSPSPARRHFSRSPSPRSKRTRGAQGEREAVQFTGSDRRKASHREEQDTLRHREHDEGRDASRDRKVDREAVHVTNGDRRKPSHGEERDSWGKHREHDEGRVASIDRKSDREDTRGTAKDKKYVRDDEKDHSRERGAGRDDKYGASKVALPVWDDDRHGRPNRGDWKSASSREQRLDSGDRRDSTRVKPTDHDGSNGGSGRSFRHGRSMSPEEHRHRGRHESHPSSRVSRSAAHIEDINSRGGEASRNGDPDALATMNATAEALEAKEKQKPSFELSGKLAEETNRVAEPLYVHRMTCYLFGRERKVADVPTDHPSCSKQHAVLQYRLVEKEQLDGMMTKKISNALPDFIISVLLYHTILFDRPYLMDLDSTNGTFINGNRIEPRRYYELFEKDTIKFGNSSREYVLLHENSTE
ncbi:FHA domain-containing protein DDL [Zea mays]|uniref:FHA domain-containing protein DDL n=1 Tax=Zea mays TaxID=4577 RepID=A0A1D6M2D8_MAIZE|nr:FHA domain-containing protein DDL [Zea mays]